MKCLLFFLSFYFNTSKLCWIIHIKNAAEHNRTWKITKQMIIEDLLVASVGGHCGVIAVVDLMHF